jgi:hypothetical protein
MTPRKLSLLALFLIVPHTLSAQGRRGGGGGGGGDIGGGAAAAGGDDCKNTQNSGRSGAGAGGKASDANRMINCMKEPPSMSKELEKANPLETLLDNKKDLKMSGDEEKELKNMNKQLKDDVKPFLKSIDSVSREMKKTGDYAPTTGQMTLGRSLTRESADSVRGRYRLAADAAIAKLAEERRQPAKDLLQKEMEAQMAARRGGRPPV